MFMQSIISIICNALNNIDMPFNLRVGAFCINILYCNRWMYVLFPEPFPPHYLSGERVTSDLTYFS